jgi:hypothetical protein
MKQINRRQDELIDIRERYELRDLGPDLGTGEIIQSLLQGTRCFTNNRKRSRAATTSSLLERGKYLLRISSNSLLFFQPNMFLLPAAS